MPASGNSGQVPAPTDILLTVRQFEAQQPAFTLGGVRWAVFNAKYNGLAESGAIVRVGSRVLIDPRQVSGVGKNQSEAESAEAQGRERGDRGTHGQ